MSRYSQDGVYTDVEPGDKDISDLLARKLGLRWSERELRDAEGRVIREGTALFHLFALRRDAVRAVVTSGRLF